MSAVGRSQPGRMLAWVVPAVLLAGVTVAAVRGASLQTAEVRALERWFPSEPGTTWVYDTVTNGRPSGPATTQVVEGSGFVSGGAALPAVTQAFRYADLVGQGPVRGLLYQAIRGDSVVSLGGRQGRGEHDLGEFSGTEPPSPLLVLPLRPGQTWTWRGTHGEERQERRTEVIERKDLRILGSMQRGCVHLRVDLRGLDPDSGGSQRTDEWHCPRLGLVRTITVVPEQDLELRQELAGFRAPGLALGRTTAPATPSTEAEPGAMIGVDGGRSNHVPDTRLDLDALRWTDARSGNVQFPPVGAGGRFVVAEEDGSVSARDAATGEMAWRLRLRGPIVAAPAAAGSTVLVADSSKTLFALDAETGLVRWSRRLADLLSTTPLVQRDVVVVATEDRRVLGLGLADGTTRWTAATGGVVASPPVLARDAVILADESGSIVALGVGDGETVWQAGAGGVLAGGVAAADGLVVAAADDGSVSGIDAVSGELRWSRPLGGYREAAVPPALGAGRVFVVAESSTDRVTLHALDAADGRQLWGAEIPGEPRGPAMVLGDEVVVLTEDARLHRFDAGQGTPGPAFTLPDLLPTQGDTAAVVPLAFVDGSLVVTVRETTNDAVHLAAAYTAYVAFTADASPTRGIVPVSELRPVEEPWRSPPALVGERLVYGGSGFTLWSVPPGGEPLTLAETSQAITFAVAAGNSVIAPLDGEIAALDPGTGERPWSVPAGEPLGGFVPAVTRAGAAVRIDDTLTLLDPGSGRPRWAQPVGGVGIGQPLPMAGGDIVFGGGELVRLDGATGAPRWRIPDTETFAPMSEHDGALFAMVLQGEETVLLSVDAATGTERWRMPFSSPILIGPAAGAGAVVAVGDDGVATAFDPVTGRALWTYALSSPTCGSPVVLGDTVVLWQGGRSEVLGGGRDYGFVVLDLATGAYLGSMEAAGSSAYPGDCGATPDGRLIVASGLVAQLTEVTSP